MRALPSAAMRLLPACLAFLAGCTNAGVDLGFDPRPMGSVTVLVYLDRDGTGTATALDTVYARARVALLAQNSSDTLRTGVTNDQGIATIEHVPLGQYRVAVDRVSLGDSVQVAQIQFSDIRLSLTDTVKAVLVRLAFPVKNIKEARQSAPGQRVFVRGIILAGIPSFRDTTAYLADTVGTIRLTQVSLLGGLVGNTPGDSVAVIGTTGTRAGQPILTLARITRVGTRPPPIPLPVTTVTAANASGGVLDANFVVVTGALISDTVTVSPDFKVTASDGSGSLNVLLDANLAFLRTAFRPGRTMDVRGVLVPDGAGGWFLKPRNVSDVILF